MNFKLIKTSILLVILATVISLFTIIQISEAKEILKEVDYSNISPLAKEYLSGTRTFTLKELENLSKKNKQAYDKGTINEKTYKILENKLKTDLRQAKFDQQQRMDGMRFMDAEGGTPMDSSMTTKKMIEETEARKQQKAEKRTEQKIQEKQPDQN